MVVKQTPTHNNEGQSICPIQFISNDSINLDNNIGVLKYKILILNNIHTISRNLPNEDLYFENCTWASGTAFQMANANDVFKEVLRANHTIVNSTSK